MDIEDFDDPMLRPKKKEPLFAKVARLGHEILILPLYPLYPIWLLISGTAKQIFTLHALVGILSGMFLKSLDLMLIIIATWGVVCQLVYVLLESRKFNKLDELAWYFKIARQAIMFTHDVFIALFFGGIMFYALKLFS